MRETNAIRCLYDFINTYLPLTVEEEKALKRCPKTHQKDKSVWIDATHKRCIVCKEIKAITDYYRSDLRTCKQCYNAKRREEYRKGKGGNKNGL